MTGILINGFLATVVLFFEFGTMDELGKEFGITETLEIELLGPIGIFEMGLFDVTYELVRIWGITDVL
jgi:hypothetical protein